VKRILVLGMSGMLGSAVHKIFSEDARFEVWGTRRSSASAPHLSPAMQARVLDGVDVLRETALSEVMQQVSPDVVINCVGLVKQLQAADDPLEVLPINAMLPHRLAKHCARTDARLIHVSTDCIFSGSKGGYIESDMSDATDLYGKSKFIGELHTLPHVITLRTSLIGHELNSAHSLMNWFLSQSGVVKGYSRAIFSGFPTVELATVIRDYILPNTALQGLYHVATSPISKYDLLRLIAQIYGKEIDIVEDRKLVIDRSLDGSRFSAETGYIAPDWPELVQRMHAFG